MNKNIKYRIKTKKEFINEFGNDWRNIVHASFVEDMDFLLGTEIDNCYINKIIDSNCCMDMTKKLLISCWEISCDMIVIIQNQPNYNSKKLVYE